MTTRRDTHVKHESEVIGAALPSHNGLRKTQAVDFHVSEIFSVWA